ncbi:hypothetical protein PHLGIDRAFT_118590 [Phlebiopsis gigantea 11061_1 CR5-6]|uniref:Uncharacterized protein n=1 Tax=Phlebiopsis gigantea (strain 11061_1 CR5-6) TaxID=745531 RepID=A0A0C3PKP0_PHLG1|nr:hypothetical protein PHLGIDRAFT_118590 [Phlebiopsis gigantea 11061_1 CR5-6]
MVNWESPAVITVCLRVQDKLTIFFSGIYMWHFLITLRHVEFPLLTGKLAWRWSYVYYLAARYLMIGTQIPLHQVTQPKVFEAMAIAGCLITVFATGNLLLRTIAVWNNHRIVQVALVLLGVGHWVVALAVAIPPIVKTAGNFAPAGNNPKTISSISIVPWFLYSFILDFVIVVMTVYGLFLQRAARSTRLWKSLYRHGIIYYVVTVAVNLPMLIFAWSTQSACLIGAFSIPGLTVSVMASSRAVTSLLELPEKSDMRRPHIQERMNVDISAFRSERLSTNINLSLSFSSLHSMRARN